VGRDWRRPRTAAELRQASPSIRVALLCSCGQEAEVIGIEQPEHEGVMLAGDRIARRPLCITCLEDDPFFWDDIIAVEEIDRA